MIDTTAHDCLVSASMKGTWGTPQLSRWRARTSLWAQLNRLQAVILSSEFPGTLQFPPKMKSIFINLRTVQQSGFLNPLFSPYRLFFWHWHVYKRSYFSEFLYLCNINSVFRHLRVHFFSSKSHWTECLLSALADLILSLLKDTIHWLVAWWLLENKLENVQVCRFWC